MLTQILIAYDDSPSARRPLAEAVCLAQVEGARLIAVAIEQHPLATTAAPPARYWRTTNAGCARATGG